MPYVKITPECLATIEARRKFPPPEHDPNPVHRCDDGYEVWPNEEVIQFLNTKAFKGETIGDTIVRLFTPGRHAGH